MTKRILVLEGPAGSGKSTLNSFLTEKVCAVPVRSSLPNRDPEAEDAIIASTINDYSKIVRALASSSSTMVIDRLVLSQVVYGRLRKLRGGESVGCLGPQHLRKLMSGLLYRAVFELQTRSYGHYNLPGVEIAWLVLLPTPAVLRYRREVCGKSYAWDATTEIDSYLDVAQLAIRISNTRYMSYSNDKDTARVQGVALNWLVNGGELRCVDGNITTPAYAPH